MWPWVASSITCRTSRRKGWNPSRQCLDTPWRWMPWLGNGTIPMIDSWLAGGDWNMAGLWLSIQLGMSWSQLTFTPSFFRGVGIPPTRWLLRTIFYECSPYIIFFFLFSPICHKLSYSSPYGTSPYINGFSLFFTKFQKVPYGERPELWSDENWAATTARPSKLWWAAKRCTALCPLKTPLQELSSRKPLKLTG